MDVLRQRIAAWTLGLFIAGLLAAQGQTIELTAPLANAEVPDGEDFATRMVGQAWNMDRLRDIAHETGYTQPTAAGGVWSGTVRAASPFFFPLSPGFLSGSYDFMPTYYSDGTPYGPLNPIAPATYRRLSFRASLSQAQRSDIHVSWCTDPNIWPNATSPAGSVGRHVQIDGEPTFTAAGSPVIARPTSGFRVYDMDLLGSTDSDGRVPWLILPPTRYFSTWNAQPSIYGLMLALSSGAPVGAVHQVDWIRLYNPDSSPQFTLTWQTSGLSWDYYHSIRIFLDRDSSGHDGDLFATTLDNTGSFTLLTAALPPGDYYAYLQVVRHENSGFTVVAQSGYSGRLRIGHAPTLDFTAPSFTSGVDYATTELGNTWDFNDGTDVTRADEVTGVQYTSGKLDGYCEAGGDPRIQLNMKKSGALVPINPQQYRYLTYRIKSDISGSSTLVERTERWSTQLTWWNTGLDADGTYSREFQQLEDYRDYFIDLWDPDIANPLYNWDYGWKTLPQVSYLRFDPLETPVRCRFWLDEIRLCAINQPSDNLYTIRWQATDPDNAELRVTLYYGWYMGGVYQEAPTPLGVVTQAPGPGSFVWNTSGLAQREYFIRGEVDDGDHTTSWLSRAPVVLTSSQYFSPTQVVRATAKKDWSFLTAWNLSTGALKVSPLWYNGDYSFTYDQDGYQQWIALFLYDDGTKQTRELRWSYRQVHVQ